jgi:hypothetical protein
MFNPYYPQQQMYQNNVYNPMMNAQQRLAQMEQQYPQYGMSPAQMSGTLNGRIVDDFANITANDVPMDNMGAVFIKSDGSEIQKRFWGNDGLIKVTSYKAILDDKSENSDILSTSEEKLKSDLSDAFTARFDEVMNKLETMEKSITGKRATKNVKSNADDVPAGNE